MRIRLALGAALVSALACAAPPLTYQTPLSVSPLRGPIQLDQIALITDASGTMYARNTLPEAKAITQTFIAGMPNDPHEAGSTGFGGTERISVPVAPFDRAALAAAAADLHPLGDIDGYGGHTPMHRVLDEVSEQLAGRGGNAGVVIVSDGLADKPAWTLAAANNLVAAHGGQVCFHTVHVGDDAMGAELLSALAATTSCGTNRSAASVRDPGSFMSFVADVYGAGAARDTGDQGASAELPADRCGDIVRLRGIEFDFDKSNVRSDAAVVLDVAVTQLRECTNLSVRVDGHTDWTGTEAYNQGLSERRAESVRRYLVDAGIDSRRLSTRGLGETDPIASNATREGRARNRRVELHPR